MNISELSAIELGKQIAARELSSEEVTRHFLDRTDQYESSVGAYITRSEDAIAQAQQVDAKIQAGESLGPVAGVPISIKDVLCVEGMPTTCGSRMLAEFHSPYTATASRRLLDAGLVLMGKTNMDEFAMGGSTETSAFGTTHNPWNLERTAGGSSGGAAASVAAGMVPFSIGTDTGGSVRQPAAFCGVCGLKPTYGRVSRYGLVAFASSLDQVGPLAHQVEDLAAALQIVSGHDPRDSTSLEAEVPDYAAELDKPLAGVKVGIVREHLEHDALDGEIRSAVERAQTTLQELGATIVDVHFPHTEYSVPTYYLVAPCEASGNLSRYDGVHYGFREMAPGSVEAPLDAMIAHSRSCGFGDEVKRRIMLGTFALSAGYYDAYYKKALQVRRLISEDYQAAFKQADILLGPVAPTTAFKLGDKVNDPVQMYLQDLFTVGANLAGIPAISVPAGFSSEKLPLSIQLQGPALGEARLLNAAYQMQQTGFFTRNIAEPK